MEKDAGSEQIDRIRESEFQKRDYAIVDIDQIKLQGENILKVLQVQITKSLLDLSNDEKYLRYEIEAYWMKELAIRHHAVSYLRNVASLINLYTQQEQVYNKMFKEITTMVEYPDYSKLEEAWLNQMKAYQEYISAQNAKIAELSRRLNIPVNEVTIKKRRGRPPRAQAQEDTEYENEEEVEEQEDENQDEDRG